MMMIIIIIIIILAYYTYTSVHLNEDADLKCGLVQQSSELCVEVTGCLQDISWNSLNIVSGHWLGFFSPGAYCGSWSIQMENCYACKNTTAHTHTHTHTRARTHARTHTHTRTQPVRKVLKKPLQCIWQLSQYLLIHCGVVSRALLGRCSERFLTVQSQKSPSSGLCDVLIL